jgi:C4-dicarboxylate transporter DctM subunit
VTLLLIFCVLVLLAVRTPLFVVIGGAAMICFALFVEGYSDVASLQVMAVKIASLTSKNVLLAIPFFVLSGALMSAGGIATRLVRVAELFVGHLRGGLAIAAVLACMIFAAISGSSPVTLIAVGGIMFPAMLKAGYPENFSLGLITTAGSLGCLIPPSIPMLVYAISVSGGAAVNVGELFLAGLGPALLIAGMLALYSWIKGAGTAATAARAKPTWKMRFDVLREGIWALLLPVLILGGIYSGTFTATEASAVSVVYAVIVELFIHRELRLKELPAALMKSVVMMGALLLIIVLAFGLNDFMVEKQAAELALEWIQQQGLSPVVFMMAINVFLVVTGCLMDSISAIVLFTPLIAPTAVALGIDPLHLGVVFIVNMEIGYVAPPIATNLFVSAQLFQRPFAQVVRSVMPTLGILVVGLILVTYVPTLSIGPVYAMKGKGFYQPFGSFGARSAVADDPVPADEPPGKVLTLEEMMKKAKQKNAADEAAAASEDAGDAPPAPADSGSPP